MPEGEALAKAKKGGLARTKGEMRRNEEKGGLGMRRRGRAPKDGKERTFQ